ncbi:hypothetical protein BKA80DRAFT_135467 [Phyllosticta citrichinensis]
MAKLDTATTVGRPCWILSLTSSSSTALSLGMSQKRSCLRRFGFSPAMFSFFPLLPTDQQDDTRRNARRTYIPVTNAAARNLFPQSTLTLLLHLAPPPQSLPSHPHTRRRTPPVHYFLSPTANQPTRTHRHHNHAHAHAHAAARTAPPRKYSKYTTMYITEPTHRVGYPAHAVSLLQASPTNHTPRATSPPLDVSLPLPSLPLPAYRSRLSTAPDACTASSSMDGHFSLSAHGTSRCYAV